MLAYGSYQCCLWWQKRDIIIDKNRFTLFSSRWLFTRLAFCPSGNLPFHQSWDLHHKDNNLRLLIDCMRIHNEDDKSRVLIHFVHISHLWGWLCFGIELSTDFPFPAEISTMKMTTKEFWLILSIFLTFEWLGTRVAPSLWTDFTSHAPEKYKLSYLSSLYGSTQSANWLYANSDWRRQ